MTATIQEVSRAVAAAAMPAPSELLTLRLGAWEYDIDTLRVELNRPRSAPHAGYWAV